MKTTTDSPFDALEKIFHEPNRLAIMSALCAADGGVPFTDLKTSCRLTDGNLSRHLKVLEETGVIRVEKSFVKLRPRTTIHLTKTGFQRFNEYLAALTEVLEQARQATGTERSKSRLPAFGKLAPA
ncbi:MAG: transcriptional regulator [Verrucomicrobia bacterium]|nr:transcriptional regulator [Verrucomicrobiota bacterium]MBU4291099.1 transcriptional regulator [Verrucomicrobiota bacterium]MBU4429351.1 transcriptional regulator [Verrucomicrobiota bacterium]MBU4498136.1 transcriptional regulator [Verrucomicrobiota bacterium]MCG2680116.1 transcriptional regulator [Kiritimatiellia bacterium]